MPIYKTYVNRERSDMPAFRKVSWLSQGEMICLHRMSTEHIYNALRCVKSGDQTRRYNNYTAKEIIDAMISEIRYREGIADTIIKRVPGLFELFKRIENTPEKGTVFCTKGR